MARGKLNQGTQRASQIRVGIVIIVALLVLGYGIIQVGRLFDVFASRYPLITLVENSAGLSAGAPVTLAGQRIGQVDEISFIPAADRTGPANIRIVLSVNRNVQDQIRRDSRASLRTQGLLGDRFVDISPGSPALAALEAGDTIRTEPALDFERVLETAANTLDDVQAMMNDLQLVAGRLAGGEGTLGSLLADDRLYERMTAVSTELAGLLYTLNHEDGTISRLIRDPGLYERLDMALVRLDTLGGAILAGEGTLGRLLHDDALYEELVGVVGRADTVLVGVAGMVQEIGDADGTLARLLEDPALYDAFLAAVIDLRNLINAVRENPREYRPDVTVRIF